MPIISKGLELDVPLILTGLSLEEIKPKPAVKYGYFNFDLVSGFLFCAAPAH